MYDIILFLFTKSGIKRKKEKRRIKVENLNNRQKFYVETKVLLVH